MSAGTPTVARATWARALGVALVPVAAEALAAQLAVQPALQRALRDGIAHGFEGALPPIPEGAECYLVRVGRETVGVLVVQRDWPRDGEAALLVVAIAAEHRGRASGTRALLAAERRLRAEGVSRLLTRVPRTNGRGLYFMLRVGFTPVGSSDAPPGDDATWFARRDRASG